MSFDTSKYIGKGVGGEPTPERLRKAVEDAARHRAEHKARGGRPSARIMDYPHDQYWSERADLRERANGAPGLVQRRILDEKEKKREEIREKRRQYDIHMGDWLLLPGQIEVYADLFKTRVEYPLFGDGNHKGGGKRGVVRGMSAASRRRMMQRCATVRGLDDGSFLHLTYPDDFPADWGRWKRDLKVFLQRVQYHFPQVAGIWRLELQIRKSGENVGLPAPHYHLLTTGLFPDNPQVMLQQDFLSDSTFCRKAERYCELYRERYGKDCGLNWRVEWLHAFRIWLAWAWYEVVGSEDIKHLFAATRAEQVQSRQHAMHYVDSYIAKSDDPFVVQMLNSLETGRVWGTFGELDTSSSLQAKVPAYGVVELRRMMSTFLQKRGAKRYAKRIKRSKLGFFVFGLGDSSSRLWEQGLAVKRTTLAAWLGWDKVNAHAAPVRIVVDNLGWSGEFRSPERTSQVVVWCKKRGYQYRIERRPQPDVGYQSHTTIARMIGFAYDVAAESFQQNVGRVTL